MPQDNIEKSVTNVYVFTKKKRFKKLLNEDKQVESSFRRKELKHFKKTSIQTSFVFFSLHST
jgi:hypothetical protein